jgi:hypothetical protein
LGLVITRPHAYSGGAAVLVDRMRPAGWFI